MATVTEQVKRINAQSENDACAPYTNAGQVMHRPGAEQVAVQPCGATVCDKHLEAHTRGCDDCDAVHALDDTED